MAKKKRREYDEGSLGQRLSDLVDHTSSLALLVFSVVIFGGLAFAGVTMIGRLGGVGWFLYAVVMGTFALVFGPVIASAMSLRERGSKRARDDKRARVEAQRAKFGLTVREREPDERSREE